MTGYDVMLEANASCGSIHVYIKLQRKWQPTLGGNVAANVILY